MWTSPLLRRIRAWRRDTIRLTERNVSRRHARILRNNGEVHIEDLGSYNGVRVNNARIAERVNLRVSDQVQIGDYKLYLKAEGVEQVDDARTMPIERIDPGTPTDVITAVSPAAPTQPLGVPQTPSPASAVSGLAANQLVGNPNRTMVAVADTDPAGRPVATAAAVAALTAPVGYGKLVVLSSNFAGKEFELSRPQMIIGRTDENDIVINHRSISRNHAKLVREPDTARYTISDLQSSNGVRVNGQDYGKVELRRGDVVDLGHVRLRFVEPGEDFVFARDAVITDVPDAGGKKGLLVAIVLGVLLLGGIGIFFAMKGSGGGKETAHDGSGSGTNGALENGNGGSDTQVAIANPNTGSDTTTVVPDKGSDGSGTPTNTVVEIDAGSATVATNQNPTTNPTASADDVKISCLKLAADKKWQDLLDCTDRLASGDPATAKALRGKAVMENKADTAQRLLRDNLKKNEYRKAKVELDKIPQDSVYRADAKSAYDSVVADAAADYENRAKALAADHKCGQFDKVVREARSEGVDNRLGGLVCKPEQTAIKNPGNPNPNPNTNPTNTGSNTTTNPPPASCDADALRQKGEDHLQTGMDAAALAAFEGSMKCRPDGALMRFAFMAACRSKNATKAKYYYPKLPAATTTGIVQICVRNGITLP